jgi:hypothetical protein
LMLSVLSVMMMMCSQQKIKNRRIGKTLQSLITLCTPLPDTVRRTVT